MEMILKTSWPSLQGLLCLILSLSVGKRAILFSRKEVKNSPEKEHLLIIWVFIGPLIIFLIIHLFACFGISNHFVTLGTMSGLIMGIQLQLSTKPSGSGTVKLIVQQINGTKGTEVWLDSMDISIFDAKEKIAMAFSPPISPSSRISIESGSGSIVQSEGNLFSMISDSSTEVSFFGFISKSCYISIKEEQRDARERTGSIDNQFKSKKATPSPFISKKLEVKYGEP